jgi:hypothetical protein
MGRGRDSFAKIDLASHLALEPWISDTAAKPLCKATTKYLCKATTSYEVVTKAWQGLRTL